MRDHSAQARQHAEASRAPAAGPDSAASRANPEPLLTRKEAAAQASVSMRTLESWIASGRLRVVRFSSRMVRVRRCDLDAFVRRHLSS